MRSRNTIQKELLEKELKTINGFFTADEFYKAAKKRSADMGIATVYRFLNEKMNRRELHSYICNNKSIYSKNFNNHCHYVCQICGKKAHIDIKDIGSINKNIKGTICHFQIDVTGVCDGCLDRK